MNQDDKQKGSMQDEEPMKQNENQGQSDQGKTEGYQEDSEEISENSGTLGGEAEYDEYGAEFYSEEESEAGSMQQPNPQQQTSESEMEKPDMSGD